MLSVVCMLQVWSMIFRSQLTSQVGFGFSAGVSDIHAPSYVFAVSTHIPVLPRYPPLFASLFVLPVFSVMCHIVVKYPLFLLSVCLVCSHHALPCPA